MQRHPEGQDVARRQIDVGPFQAEAVHLIVPERREFVLQHRAQRGALPVVARQQVVGLGQGEDSSLQPLAAVLVPARLPRQGLNGGQGVADAVVQLVQHHGLPLLQDAAACDLLAQFAFVPLKRGGHGIERLTELAELVASDSPVRVPSSPARHAPAAPSRRRTGRRIKARPARSAAAMASTVPRPISTTPRRVAASMSAKEVAGDRPTATVMPSRSPGALSATAVIRGLPRNPVRSATLPR